MTRMDRRHEPVCLKSHAVSRWVGRQLGQIEHERRVASVATALFDLTASLHGLGGSELRILKLAALVHDVGRAIDDDTHPVQGARMLLREEDLPLTGSERRWLAYLTRYHKGRVPAPGCDGILRRKDDHHRLRVLLGILRTADAMDSRHAETPHLRFCLEGRRLRIACGLSEDSSKARRIYTRRKKFHLLEEMLGCQVEVTLTRIKSPKLLVA